MVWFIKLLYTLSWPYTVRDADGDDNKKAMIDTDDKDDDHDDNDFRHTLFCIKMPIQMRNKVPLPQKTKVLVL